MDRMKFGAGLAAGVALAVLGGCVPTSVKVPIGQGVLVAEAGADGVNRAAIAASPLLHGEAALRVRACVDATNQATTAAKDLYRRGDIGGASKSTTDAFAAIADCTQRTRGTTP